MSLNESIVEDAALIVPGASLTRPLPAGEKNREAIRRLHPAIPEEAREGAVAKSATTQTKAPKP